MSPPICYLHCIVHTAARGTCHVSPAVSQPHCPNTAQWAVTQWAKCLSILTIKSVNKGSLPKIEMKCIDVSIHNFTNNHYPSNVVSKLKSIPSSLLLLPHNDQAYCTICTQMRGWCLYVCLHSTLYILAPCPQPGVFSAPLAWDRAKVGERRPGEVPQPSSHPPTRPIPPPVPSCTPLTTWSTTVHLLSSAAPRPARAQHN